MQTSIRRGRISKFHIFAPRNAAPCRVPPGAHAPIRPLPAATDFNEIGSSAAELWRHSDFQGGGRQPCWIWFKVMVVHPRSAGGAVCFTTNFGLIGFTFFGDRAIFIFWHFGLKLPIHAHFRGFWEHFPQMTSSVVVTPKRHLLARKHVVWAIKRENRSNGSTWAQDRDKKGQDRTGQDSQKVTKALYFTYLGRSPYWTDFHKINCTVVAVPDVITCANLWTEIFRGYDFTGGRISRFPIDSCMDLTTVQRYSALPVMERRKTEGQGREDRYGTRFYTGTFVFLYF